MSRPIEVEWAPDHDLWEERTPDQPAIIVLKQDVEDGVLLAALWAGDSSDHHLFARTYSPQQDHWTGQQEVEAARIAVGGGPGAATIAYREQLLLCCFYVHADEDDLYVVTATLGSSGLLGFGNPRPLGVPAAAGTPAVAVDAVGDRPGTSIVVVYPYDGGLNSITYDGDSASAPSVVSDSVSTSAGLAYDPTRGWTAVFAYDDGTQPYRLGVSVSRDAQTWPKPFAFGNDYVTTAAPAATWCEALQVLFADCASLPPEPLSDSAPVVSVSGDNIFIKSSIPDGTTSRGVSIASGRFSTRDRPLQPALFAFYRASGDSAKLYHAKTVRL